MTDQELLDFYAEEKDATFRIYRARAGKSAEDYLELKDLIRLTRLVIDKEEEQEMIAFHLRKEKRENDLMRARSLAEMERREKDQ